MSLHQERLAKVCRKMEEAGLSQLLVTDHLSIYYLTGIDVVPFERFWCLLVKTDGTHTLFANRLFALRGNIDAELIEYDDTQDCVRILADGLQSGPIGIDKLWPSHFTIRLMDARGDIRPVVGSRCVDDARSTRTRRSCNGCAKAPIKTTMPPCRPSRACTPA